MLICAKAVLRQLAEESQVALAHQARTGLCGFFYFGNHPNKLIGRGRQTISLFWLDYWTKPIFRSAASGSSPSNAVIAIF